MTMTAAYYAETYVAKIIHDHRTENTVLRNVIKIFVVGIITIFTGSE